MNGTTVRSLYSLNGELNKSMAKIDKKAYINKTILPTVNFFFCN
jgi:hypothetical protein